MATTKVSVQVGDGGWQSCQCLQLKDRGASQLGACPLSTTTHGPAAGLGVSRISDCIRSVGVGVSRLTKSAAVFGASRPCPAWGPEKVLSG
jgi:hypothetical protein